MSRKKITRSTHNEVEMLPPAEQCLLRPDVWIGRVLPKTEKMWVYRADGAETAKMVPEKVKYSPGYFKIFDEILVNAVDNRRNDEPQNSLRMDTIWVNFDKETNEIKVKNNGKALKRYSNYKEKKYKNSRGYAGTYDGF